MPAKNYVAYRCSLCGEVVLSDTVVADDDMPGFCNTAVRLLNGTTPPYALGVLLCVTHRCADGSIGLAYLAGVEKSTSNN